MINQEAFMEDTVARTLKPLSNDDLAELFEEVIKLFLEYREKHHYSIETAQGRAVCDLVDRVRGYIDTAPSKGD